MAQLKKSRAAWQALNIEKQSRAQKSATVQKQAFKLVTKAEQEASDKYLAKFHEFKVGADKEYQKKEAKILKEVAKTRFERDTTQETLHSKSQSLEGLRQLHNKLKAEVLEEKETLKKSEDLVLMLN